MTTDDEKEINNKLDTILRFMRKYLSDSDKKFARKAGFFGVIGGALSHVIYIVGKFIWTKLIMIL